MAARRKTGDAKTKADILHGVLDSAAALGWENVRLYRVAHDLSLPLAEVRRHFTDLNAVADFWFADALEAMLQEEANGFGEMPPKERLLIKMQRWLDHLAGHRTVAVQMIRGKLHPPHVHHWAPMAFDLSRLIHWWLDAARIASTGPKRQAAEVGLTAIFLMTLARWARDGSPGQRETHRFLERRLTQADGVIRLWPRRGGS